MKFVKKYRFFATIFMLGSALLPINSLNSLATENSTQIATTLINRFSDDLVKQNQSDLASFIAPTFIAQRQSGAYADKDKYLANLPTVTANNISDIHGNIDGDALITRFDVLATGKVDSKSFSAKKYPRLITFEKINGQWQVTSLSNFDPGVASDTQTSTVADPTFVSTSDVIKNRAQGFLHRFYMDLVHGNSKDLRFFLSPAFLLQRENGAHLGKNGYLNGFARVKTFKVSNIVAKSDGVVMVIRYNTANTGKIDTRAFSKGSTARLMTLVNVKGQWFVTSLSNFDPGVTTTKKNKK